MAYACVTLKADRFEIHTNIAPGNNKNRSMSHVLPQKIKPCIVRFISPSLSNQRLPYDSLLLALFCICQDRNKTSLLPPMLPPPLRPLVGKLFSATGTLGLQVRMPRDFGAPAPLPFEPKEPRTSPLKKTPGNVYKEMFILKRLLQILGFCSENKSYYCLHKLPWTSRPSEFPGSMGICTRCILGKHGAFDFPVFFLVWSALESIMQ